MRIQHLFILLFFSFTTLTGCSDNSTGSDGGSSNKSLGVRLVNTGSEDLEVETGSDNKITFCYDKEGCTELGGGGFATVFPDQEMVFNESDPDKFAIGVKVGVKITAGKGKIEIVRGESYRDDAGFLEFTPSEVVHTSDTYTAGDTAVFEWGETD
ncbi:hypothetical protein [Fodinibius sediminis]|uniref:Lipoprotein n=1 Tax=Fodinibius sediminis TaxID=1214077 RepID=A0A521ALT9_9BACT|nr:hypothetical protein [Fodinibius sediminis]SMO35779.1 hypothetical protein SAMN06265218_101202 [Fodinibius sediminis]